MTGPAFWVIAGPNGSGKSSISGRAEFQALIGVAVLNPDARTREILIAEPHLTNREANLRAVIEAEEEVRAKIEQGVPVAIETVLSTDKFLKHVRAAKAKGLAVKMMYVALPEPDDNVARVRLRVEAGGHDVPEDKIRERWESSHRMLERFAPLLDYLVVIDTSAGAPVVAATKIGGVIVIDAPGRLPRVETALLTRPVEEVDELEGGP